MGLNRDCAGTVAEGKSLRNDKRSQNRCDLADDPQCGGINPTIIPKIAPGPIVKTGPACRADKIDGPMAEHDLFDELQALFSRLGAAEIYLTAYLVEFGGLSQHLTMPLLRKAAGGCAMLRLPAKGRHLVLYLGPEPSEDRGGFPGRLRRGLAALTDTAPPGHAWAQVRMLRCCNHDIAAPAQLLFDLKAAAPRILGTADP
jgi:hypothetical protein